MKRYKNEIALGAFTLAAAVILGYMTLTVGKFQFGPTTNVKAVFDSASGVVNESIVMVAGVEVGHVKKINLEDNKAVMDIMLNEGIKVSKNVKAVIRAKSLLGEKFVELVPYESSEYLQNGDIIKNTVTPVEIDQLVTTLGPIMIKLGPVLEKFDPQDLTGMLKTISTALKGKEDQISRIISNTDSLLNFFSKNESRFNKITTNIEALSNDAKGILNQNKPAINRIVNNTDKIVNDFGQDSDKLAARINVITANLEEISSEFQKNSPQIIRKVDDITSDIKVLTNDFRKNSPDLAKKVNSLTTNLDNMLVSLNKDAPDLAKDLSTVIKDLSKISNRISEKGPKFIDNTDELLVNLVTTLRRLEPLMKRLEKFDDKAIVSEVERVMREIGIKIHLF